MVQDFYNRDFSESIADNHTELSQEGRLFIEIVKKISRIEEWTLRDRFTFQRCATSCSK